MELLRLLEMIPAYFGDAQIRPNSLKIVSKAKQIKILSTIQRMLQTISEYLEYIP